MNETYKYLTKIQTAYVFKIILSFTVNVLHFKVVDIPTTKLSLLIEVIEDATPAGVKVSVHKHTEELETLKYIPDNELKTLKNQLEEMGGSRKKK